MNDPRGYYALLGVARTATAADIKSAFYERAKALHPDTGELKDGAAFQALAEAYDVLGNFARRTEYDQRWEGQTLEWLPRTEPPSPLPPPRSSRRWALAGCALLLVIAFVIVAHFSRASRDIPAAGANDQSAEPSGPPALSRADADTDAAVAEALAPPAAASPSRSSRPTGPTNR